MRKKSENPGVYAKYVEAISDNTTTSEEIQMVREKRKRKGNNNNVMIIGYCEDLCNALDVL